MTFSRPRRRPRFNGAEADHALTEQWPAQLRTDEMDGATYKWGGANDIGVMAIATFTHAAPLDDYQPQPPSFPALPPAPEPAAVVTHVLAPVPVTEPAVIGDELRLPVIWCEMNGCIGWFHDPDSTGFADARQRARQAGWRTDANRMLACPQCQQGRADYRTPQPLTWHHPSVARGWHERGDLPSDEALFRLSVKAEYGKQLTWKNYTLACTVADATHRTAAS